MYAKIGTKTSAIFSLNILSLDPMNSYIGWCAMECCDGEEETCYEYDDGYSKPFTKQYCKAVRTVKSIYFCFREAHIEPSVIISLVAISNS